jgi:ferrochelatase
LVLTPGFVADCLETIEEIGIRLVEDFRAAGGEALHVVPCLNAHQIWIDALESLIRRSCEADLA